MSNKNSAVEALSDLIRNANLGEDEKAALRQQLRKKRGPNHYRTGPVTKVKKGETVTVIYPDGTPSKMTVWKAGTMTLRLSTLTAAQLTVREINLRNRIAANSDITSGRFGQETRAVRQQA